ncbi:hypothetical protein F2Q70_00020791 [Brassica cretica]|uniref:Uncharacterized protein n=2 Tax=Brassica cretica TaxID=69181 RepID=A0A8S9GVH2_BRACR|nr:hypothetical protein F2Q70_00020791 [Brassica cretica]
MIYTAIDNLYLTEEQIKTSPSRKDGIDEATEVALRIYGCDCDLIQEGSSAKKSLAKFDVKLQAVSGLHQNWKRNLKRQRQVIDVFHRMECRREKKYLRELLFVKSSCPCDEGEAATRIKEYMKDNRSKDEIVRILQQQHAIPVYFTMKAWDQIEIESPATDQGPTQLASTSMGTAGRDTGASSSSLHVPPPTGDALIPVQQALSSVLTRTAQNVPRDNRASSSSSQVPPETANAPVQQPLSPKTEILMKILATLVEMKSKQDQMLHLMSDGRKRTRDEQDQTQQESPDSRRQRLD